MLLTIRNVKLNTMLIHVSNHLCYLLLESGTYLLNIKYHGIPLLLSLITDLN